MQKGVSQKSADFMNAVFTVFRKFGMANHLGENWLMGLSLCPASIREVQDAKGRLPEI
jgi:hypothetical protein